MGKKELEDKSDGVEEDWRFGLDFKIAKACLAPACVLTSQARRVTAFAYCDYCSYFLSNVHLPAKSFKSLPDCKYSFASCEFFR